LVVLAVGDVYLCLLWLVSSSCLFPSALSWPVSHACSAACVHILLQRLRELDIEIFEDEEGGKDYSKINEGDVVIFPAFGATVGEMTLFRDRNVSMVDTTCPWVAKVWNSVDQHAR